MKPSPFRYLACFPILLIGIVAGFVWTTLVAGYYAGQSYVHQMADQSTKTKP